MREIKSKLETGKQQEVMGKHTYFPLWDPEKKNTRINKLYAKYKKEHEGKTLVTRKDFALIIHKFDEVLFNKILTNPDGIILEGLRTWIEALDPIKHRRKGMFSKKHNFMFYLETRLSNKYMKRARLLMSKALIEGFRKKDSVTDFLVSSIGKDSKEENFDYFDIFNDF